MRRRRAVEAALLSVVAAVDVAAGEVVAMVEIGSTRSTSHVSSRALVGKLLAEEECGCRRCRRCRPALRADKQGGASTCFLAGDVVDLAPQRRRAGALRGGRP